jgi:predicted SAM-dependent methyltransferase
LEDDLGMTKGSTARAAVRRAPGATRFVAALRRLIGSDPARLQRDEQQLAAHEQAIRDILPALQEVQGPVVDDLGARLAEVEQHLPTLLNTISSGHGATRRIQREFGEMVRREQEFATSLAELWSRIELIRRELMFEVKYGDGADRAGPTVESKVVDQAKVDAARAAGLRVNLGCGHIPLDGYVNVDMRDLPGVDVIAPVDDVPFAEGEVKELFSSHLVEHFPEERFTREVLPYWVSLIEEGGTFRAILPDAGSMLRGFAEGTVTYADLREVLYGGQEYEGDFHFNMYTVDSLREILEGAGLEDVVVEAEGRVNGACLEMQLSARRPR